MGTLRITGNENHECGLYLVTYPGVALGLSMMSDCCVGSADIPFNFCTK